MENFKLYIISGKARHGKTTIAKMISDKYKTMDKKCINTSYAKYIRMYATELTEWDGNMDTKPRTFLQNIGALLRSEVSPTFFIDRMKDDINLYKRFVDIITIDDARMPKEIDTFTGLYPNNVVTIKVIRPNFDSDLTPEQKSNITEVSLDNYDKYDYTIENDGSLDDLRNKIDSLIERIEK